MILRVRLLSLNVFKVHPYYSMILYFIAFLVPNNILLGLPRWLSYKESACNAGNAEDAGSILGSGRSPGGGHGNSL